MSTGDFLWIKRSDNGGRDGYLCGGHVGKWLFCHFCRIPARGFPLVEDFICKIERAPAALMDDAFPRICLTRRWGVKEGTSHFLRTNGTNEEQMEWRSFEEFSRTKNKILVGSG